MAQIHKQEFNVRHLSTQEVYFFPARAQIVRSIENLTLKPGPNEVTIYGLTPTADESSIKVDGKGAATITDMIVELVPNQENFDDVYFEDSEDEDSDDFAEHAGSSEDESDILKAIKQEEYINAGRIKHASEKKASALGRLEMLEKYARSVGNDRPQDLEARLKIYREERKKAYDDHFASEAELSKLEKERCKIEKRRNKALKTTKKQKVKEAKDRNSRRRALQQRLAAKNRLKEERVKFWPRKIYRIILSLDTNSDMTPASSRRGSIDSLAKSTEEQSRTSQISLSISYITHSAWWSPHYDLSLNTMASSGLLLYRAEICNTTSETWTDAKVILSTSQTAFQGIGEQIPAIQPWHVRLNHGSDQGPSNTNGALVSVHEMQCKQQKILTAARKWTEPREALFGLGKYTTGGLFRASSSSPPQQHQRFQQSQQMQQQTQQQIQQRASAASGSSLSRAPQQVTPSRSNGGNLFDHYSNSEVDQQRRGIEDYADTLVPEAPSLATQESEWSETGMTASYEIPGLRTIAPGDTKHRHKIISISLTDIHFSHHMVPKLRTAAFLKAHIRNTSSITLLKGPVGLTLDGSFLGNASLPHSSAGQLFSLSLGVDPSVTITYSKPVVKRSQTGVFQKEGNGVYTRTCTITNTKADRSLEGIVQDQVPVSEDDRLKVDISQPYGLRAEGDTVKSGTAIAAAGKATEKWGSAKATLKKSGEVSWNINLEPSRGVKLVLDSMVDNRAISNIPVGGNKLALQDYQMQLMLMEQQNKRRLLMARQEQEKASEEEGCTFNIGNDTLENFDFEKFLQGGEPSVP
ncbi:hypothetical protein ACLMJK_005443 [Lecanora helva]